MNSLLRSLMLAALAPAAGHAFAAPPAFTASCPGGVELRSDGRGVVTANGKATQVKKINDNFYDARQGAVTYSIGLDGGRAEVTYTGAHRAHGICQVTAGAPAAAPAAKAPARPSAAERAGQGQFDATGEVPCAQAEGQPMRACRFGVAREAGGTAALVVTHADGRRRALFFERGKAIGADLSQADGSMRFKARKQADLFLIEAGHERYEIPEAAVLGG